MKTLLTLTIVIALACPVIAAPPTAEFVAAPIAGTAPLEVTFTDFSSGTPAITSWEWDFGDGSALGYGASPVHQYTSAGTFHVTLTVIDNDGDDDIDVHTVIVGHRSVLGRKPAGGQGGEGMVDGIEKTHATGQQQQNCHYQRCNCLNSAVSEGVFCIRFPIGDGEVVCVGNCGLLE